MSDGLNEVRLIGNLGRDPEVRTTQSGDMIVNLSIATTKSWKDRNSGERRERTEWHRVVIYSNGLAKVVEEYLHKGSKVYVAGTLQTRKWTDSDGNDRYSTEVALQPYEGKLLMLDVPALRSSGGGEGPRSKFNSESGDAPDLDSDIPF